MRAVHEGGGDWVPGALGLARFPQDLHEGRGEGGVRGEGVAVVVEEGGGSEGKGMAGEEEGEAEKWVGEGGRHCCVGSEGGWRNWG